MSIFAISSATEEESSYQCFACKSMEKSLTEIAGLVKELPDCLYDARGEGNKPNPCDCAVCKLKAYVRVKP